MRQAVISALLVVLVAACGGSSAPQPPTTPAASATPTAALPGQAVQFTAESTDPQGGAIAYAWSFGDGANGTGASATHAYAAEGTFLARVTATSSSGLFAIASITVAVAARAPTAPQITVLPDAPFAGATATLSGVSSDPQGSAVTYAWTLGDGATATGASVSHAWSAAATYPVQVTATNAFGKSTSTSRNVVVKALLPPTTPVASATPATALPGQSVQFLAESSDPQGGTVAYAWSFGDGTNGTGASVTHPYGGEGAFSAQVTATNAASLSTSASVIVNVVAQAPTAPVITVAPDSPIARASASLAAVSSDPQGSALTYAWSFGDGATATGASVTHAWSSAATYTLQVTATNAFGKSTSATRAVLVREALPPTEPVITVTPNSPFSGGTASISAVSNDPQGSALTYAWSFGDGATATGASVTHAWNAAATYTVQVTAANAYGRSTSATRTVLVQGSSPWTVYCSGPSCGASDSMTYAGTGTGVWRYANDTASQQTVDAFISGVRAGNRALVLFTNGENASTSLPAPGVAASPTQSLRAIPLVGGEPDPQQDRLDSAHEEMLLRNQELGRSLLGARPTSSWVQAAPVQPLTAPAVGSTRTWIDNGVSPPATYTGVVAQDVCALTGGRSAVFWVDPASWAAGDVTPATLASFRAAFCGATGGYARTAALLGEAWGSVANSYPTQLIPEAAGSPQDVNIVFLGVPSTVAWGGYFWGGNNFLSSALAGSNQALAFFINAPNARGSTSYYVSVLVHELTHMVNFYQRYIVNGADHATWLEETSAMMSEDVVGPVINGGYSAIPGQRVVPYLRGGGAVSLVGWPANVPRPNYNMGGSLAAFLDRRYGTAVYQGLVACPGTTDTASYACLDGLIRTNGGAGFADDLARMGASAFGALPATGVPDGFGFPQKTTGAYTLAGIDLAASASQLQDPATALGAAFAATTHTYAVDTVAAGRTTYARTGIVVPPRTTVLLVIR
jgi:PKD repeat protein